MGRAWADVFWKSSVKSQCTCWSLQLILTSVVFCFPRCSALWWISTEEFIFGKRPQSINVGSQISALWLPPLAVANLSRGLHLTQNKSIIVSFLGICNKDKDIPVSVLGVLLSHSGDFCMVSLSNRETFRMKLMHWKERWEVRNAYWVLNCS